MKLSAMRFNGYTWHHNPKTLEIASEKKVVKIQLPYADDAFINFGEKPIRISGVGELYGDDCIEQYKKLKSVYKRGEGAILCLPKFPAFYACFDKLSLTAKPSASVLEYGFSFSILKERPECDVKIKEVVCEENTSLWDISYTYGVDIETLVKLNGHIMFINDLKKGVCVKLC